MIINNSLQEFLISQLLNPNTLTSVLIYAYSIQTVLDRFPKIMTCRISLIIQSFFSYHFLYSGDCNVRFGGDIVRRIQMLVTLRNQRVERKSSHLNSRTDLKLLIIIISADPDCCAQLSKYSRSLPALDVLWVILDLLPVLPCQSDSLSTLVILSVSTLRTSF